MERTIALLVSDGVFNLWKVQGDRFSCTPSGQRGCSDVPSLCLALQKGPPN